MQGVELCGGWCRQQILPLKDPMWLSGHNPLIHYKMATSSMEVRERHMWVEWAIKEEEIEKQFLYFEDIYFEKEKKSFIFYRCFQYWRCSETWMLRPGYKNKRPGEMIGN